MEVITFAGQSEAKLCLCRQLQVAVLDENFAQAAELRDHMRSLRDSMPPAQQFLAHKLQQLDFGTAAEQEEALQAIGKSLELQIMSPGCTHCTQIYIDLRSQILSKIKHPKYPSASPCCVGWRLALCSAGRCCCVHRPSGQHGDPRRGG